MGRRLIRIDAMVEDAKHARATVARLERQCVRIANK